MKNKGIILSIVGIVLISTLLIILNKNDKKYIIYDNALLALTLDGKLISEFPEETNYRVDVSCENASGKWLVDEWELSIENITGNVTCNINFTTKDSDDELVKVVQSAIPSNNFDGNGYRYNGIAPNNYIWFNNEMWRIIGSIPTCTSSGCSSSTNLVKIIRDNSIGAIAFDAKDSGYTGVWGSNTLYSLLNTHYYATSQSNLNGQNHTGCYIYANSTVGNCNFSNNGILSTSYYGKMIKKVYWNTGGVAYDATASSAYTYETATQTVSGYIGLINVSDFGYASNSTYHSISMKSSTQTFEIRTTNWLFGNAAEHTINPYNTNNTYALYISENGFLNNSGGPHYGYKVRPVVYLNPSVYVVSGDGSITNPYQVAM